MNQKEEEEGPEKQVEEEHEDAEEEEEEEEQEVEGTGRDGGCSEDKCRSALTSALVTPSMTINASSEESSVLGPSYVMRKAQFGKSSLNPPSSVTPLFIKMGPSK